MNHPSNSTRDRDRTHASRPSDRAEGVLSDSGIRVRRLLGELLRGLTLAAAGLLLGTCPAFFGALPFGIALASAASSYTWWIAGGCILGTFLLPQSLSGWTWAGVYIFLLTLRLCIRFFVDPPSHADGRPLRARVYLSLCRASFLRNIGLVSDGGQAESLPLSGYLTPEMRLFGEHPFLRMLTSAAAGFAAGLFGMIAGGFHVYDLFGTLFLLVACPILTLLLVSCFGEAGLTLLFSPAPLRDTPLREDRKVRRDGQAPTGRDGGVSELTSRFRLLPLLSVVCLLVAVVFAARERYLPPVLPYLKVELSLFLALIFSLFAASRLGPVPGVAVAVAVGLSASPRLSPILILAVGGFALLRLLSPRAGLLGGVTVGMVWCAAVEGIPSLVQHLPATLLAIPAYLLVERLAVAFPLTDAPAHVDRELEGFTASVTAALTAENRAEMQRARLFALSEAFSALSRRFSDLSGQLRRPRAADLRRICDDAFSGSCAHCRNRAQCREREQAAVREARTRILSALEEGGRVEADELPTVFAEICPHTEDILTAANRGYARLRESLLRHERTDIFASDFAAMAALLGDALEADRMEAETMGGNRETADRIYDTLTERGLTVHGVVVTGRRTDGRRRVILQGRDLPAETAAVEDIRRLLEDICGATLMPPVAEPAVGGDTVLTFAPRARLRASYAGSTVPAGHPTDAPLPSPLTDQTPAGTYAPPAVCGDHVALFHSGDASFYALISDGMGSVEEASVTSEICTAFLEKMLSAGGSAELSLRMLDGYLHAKNTGTEGECSATVDLMELDLMDGHAVFAKNGAAPTYVVRDGTVYKLRSRSLPLGILKDTPPELLRFRMDPGDVVVMVSDGVTRGRDECPWLIDLLSTSLPRSMDELRRDIIRRALSSGSEDDLSAIAIRVERR